MTANELMLGDWVKNMVHNTYFKVDIDALRLLPDWPLEPIPLTEKILKKNGFKMCKYDGWVHYYEIHGKGALPFVIHSMVGGEMLSREVDSYSTSHEGSCGIDMDYVHELQHALRLCGRNDLADNFKI